jgi:hypothetical protein
MKLQETPSNLQFSIQRLDETRRIVFGTVYAPNKMDAYGWFMQPEEVEKMAHRFMQLDLKKVIDTNHDNVPNGSYPVQSYIAKENDPEYEAGSWVLAVKVVGEETWSQIVEGELNGFSMEILVKRVPATVKYELVSNQVGETEENEDHSHFFYAQVDDTGRIIGGKTSISAGHSHEIKLNSVTENYDGHSHRFFIGK